METKNLTTESSLKIIAETMERSRMTIAKNSGRPLILWGCLVAVTSVIIYFLWSKTGSPVWNLLWFAMSIIGFICTIFMVAMSKHAIFERFSYYFLIFLILLVPVIYKSLLAKGINTTLANGKTIVLTSEKQRKMLAMGFLAGVLALSYFHFYYGLFENAHGVLPYDIWLRFDGVKMIRDFIRL